MTADQVTAFNASVGAFFSPGDMRFAIAAMILTLAFTWLAWVGVSAYAGVARNTHGFGTLVGLILRGAVVLALLTYFIR
jgi:integrating conjugative element protein (TIGR03758 family)